MRALQLRHGALANQSEHGDTCSHVFVQNGARSRVRAKEHATLFACPHPRRGPVRVPFPLKYCLCAVFCLRRPALWTHVVTSIGTGWRPTSHCTDQPRNAALAHVG